MFQKDQGPPNISVISVLIFVIRCNGLLMFSCIFFFFPVIKKAAYFGVPTSQFNLLHRSMSSLILNQKIYSAILHLYHFIFRNQILAAVLMF